MIKQWQRWLWLAALAGAAAVVGATGVASQAGELDPSFDGDGKVVTHFGGNSADSGNAVVVDDTQRIVVAGTANGNFAVARYNPDGSPDLSFDGDGQVTTDFGQDDQAVAIALQPDGRIVVAGTSTATLPPFAEKDFALARYNLNGSLDSSFDGDGKAIVHFALPARAHGVAIDGSLGVVVVGDTGAAGAFDLALARLTPGGLPDPSFDGDGQVVTNLGGDEHGNAVALQADGKIVLAGWSTVAGSADFAVARYTTAGSLDPLFSGDGWVVTNLGGPDTGNALAIQTDQRIVVAGNTVGSDLDMAAVRYTSSGQPDESFGIGGVAIHGLVGDDAANGVAIQANDRIVLAGRSGPANASDFAVRRLLTNGDNDPDFGLDGAVVTNFGGNDFGYGIALQADQRSVVAGESNVGGTRDFAVARYLAVGTVIPTPTGATPTLTATATGTPTGTASATASSSPTATATESATSQSTTPPPTTPIATDTGTRPATDTRTPTGTATTTNPGTRTATPTATGPTAVSPTAMPCAPMSDVGLVAPAANAAEAKLLGDTLAKHALAWRTATGKSLVYQIYVYDGRQTYQQWLGRRLDNGFAGPGFCAQSYVAVVSDNDLSKYYRRLVNLGSWVDGAPPLPGFLDYAWAQIRMPDRLGEPYALPWLRSACSESYANLAMVPGAAGAQSAYELMQFLVSEPQQHVNYEAKATTGARLAFPTISEPYASGWTTGGKVTCVTRPPLEVPDPRLVNEAIDIARLNARDLDPILRSKFRIERYSVGPDTDNVLYDSVERSGAVVQQLAGAGSWVATSAVATILKEPVSSARMAELLASAEGVIVGEVSFYAPKGQSVTPTPVPTARSWPHAMFLPSLSETRAGGDAWAYRGYAVLWRSEAGTPRAWLVRPDGSLASAADVARDLGLPVGSIVFEDVLPALEPSLNPVVWAEQGSKKVCWGFDGFKWCQKK
jgi:uncharacterized delta-60 repeat protein